MESQFHLDFHISLKKTLEKGEISYIIREAIGLERWEELAFFDYYSLSNLKKYISLFLFFEKYKIEDNVKSKIFLYMDFWEDMLGMDEKEPLKDKRKMIEKILVERMEFPKDIVDNILSPLLVQRTFSLKKAKKGKRPESVVVGLAKTGPVPMFSTTGNVKPVNFGKNDIVIFKDPYIIFGFENPNLKYSDCEILCFRFPFVFYSETVEEINKNFCLKTRQIFPKRKV